MSSAPPPSSKAPPSSRQGGSGEGGSGKYLIIIVVLALALGGLLYWRSSQEEPAAQPAPIPSSSAVVTTSPVRQEEPDIPPPPPPAPEAGAPVKPTVVYTGGGGAACEATCKGSATPELRSALAFRAKTAHKCYDEALANDSTLKGLVVIDVKVGRNGSICSANVVSSELSNPGVGQCIANRFRQGASLPAPAGGCVEANVPISLLPPH